MFKVTVFEVVVNVAVLPMAVELVVVEALGSVIENWAAPDTSVWFTVTCLNVGSDEETATVTFAVLLVCPLPVLVPVLLAALLVPENMIGIIPTAL
jgi:hypothetical protein